MNLNQAIKRIEKVSEETRVVTLKLKKAVDAIAQKLADQLKDLSNSGQYDYTFRKIADKLLIMQDQLYWEYEDFPMECMYDFCLNPTENYPNREVTLKFAKALTTTDLLEKIEKKIKTEKAKTEKLLNAIE